MRDEVTGHPAPGARTPVVILLIDDHALFRGTVERFLRQASDTGTQVVSTAATPEALAVAAAVQPEIMVVELSQPLSHALDLIRTLRARVPPAGIIALSWGESDADEAEALAAGADRCRAKRDLDTALIDTIAAVRADH